METPCLDELLLPSKGYFKDYNYFTTKTTTKSLKYPTRATNIIQTETTLVLQDQKHEGINPGSNLLLLPFPPMRCTAGYFLKGKRKMSMDFFGSGWCGGKPNITRVCLDWEVKPCPLKTSGKMFSSATDQRFTSTTVIMPHI